MMWCCALSSGGTVLSWGCGQLGRKGPPNSPLPVPGFGANDTAGRAVAVAASEYTHMVITETGQVGLCVAGMFDGCVGFADAQLEIQADARHCLQDLA